MSNKWNRGKKQQGALPLQRRRKALAALEEDLKKGTLRVAGERSDTPLSDKNKERIMKEISTLKKTT